jgi:hypothetical protein
LELQMLDAMVTRTVDAKFIKNHQNWLQLLSQQL